MSRSPMAIPRERQTCTGNRSGFRTEATGIWRPVVHCVAGLAAAAADAGDAGRAGQLWGAREALERELGWRILPYERAQYVGAITACLKAEPIAFQSAAVRGGQMTLSVIIESALGWQPPP